MTNYITCLACGSVNVNSDSVDTGHGGSAHRRTCADCGASEAVLGGPAFRPLIERFDDFAALTPRGVELLRENLAAAADDRANARPRHDAPTWVVDRAPDADGWIVRERHARPDAGGYGPWDARDDAVDFARDADIPRRVLIATDTGYDEVR